MNENTQEEKEILKVREYLGVVVELRSDNTQKAHRRIIEKIFNDPDVSGVKYQVRTVEKIRVIPESKLKRGDI